MLTGIMILWLASGNGRAAPPSALPPHMFLVRAVVVGEEERRSEIRNTLRIEHVYGGEGDVNGKTFFAFSAERDSQRFSGNVIVPRLQLGEESIWLVKQPNDQLLPEHLYNYAQWPARINPGSPHGPSYQTMYDFAKRVEMIAHRPKRDAVIASLKRAATDRNPYISSWAISRLADIEADEDMVPDLLNSLVGVATVPVQGQVGLDKALIKVRGRSWRESERRLRLFQNWLSADMDSRDAHLVVTRLDEASQHPTADGFPQEDVVKLVRLLAENDHFPLAERQGIRYVLKWAARRYDYDQKVFEVAVDLVASDLPEELRTRAAWVLAVDVNLDDERREILRGLRKRVRGASVIKSLDDALTRHNDIKKP